MRIIPDIVSGQTVCAVRETVVLAEAARRMADVDVGSVVVVDGDDRLIGVVTERDIARRVVAQGLDPETITVAQIMSRNPDTVAPDNSPLEALEIMWMRRIRHLPVVDGDRVVGMVSIRDLCEVIRLGLEQAIGETETSLFDDLSGT